MTNDGDEVPAFLLQEMPVLESDNQSRVGGQLSLGSDYSSPYPPVGKMRGTVTHSRQEDSLSDHGYSKISGDSLATPVRAFSGYSDPSVGSSPASYHTAASSGYGSSSHSPHGARSSPFVTDNTPSPWRQGGPSSRGNNNSAYYKYPGSVSASFSSSSLNSTPQHMKYSRRPEIDDTPSVISRYRGPNNSDNGLWGDSMNKYQQQQQTPSPNFPSSATTPGSATIISVSSSPPSITRRRGSDVTSVTTSPTNVPWKVSDPAEWPVDRVLYWLETNRFGPDWIDAFQAKNIHGEQFLSLTSYQNFKKLGHMPAGKTDEYDNSPSRFIHILRKMLNKSNSNQSSEDVPLAIEFSKQLHSNTTRVPSAEQTLQSRPALRLPARSRSTGEMKHGIPEPRQQQQPVILSNSSDKGITDDNRDIYIMDKSSPGLSTLIEPFNSVNLKQSPHSEMVSLDSVKQQQQQLPVPRTTRIDRGAPNHVRPFSTVDTVYSKSSLIPSVSRERLFSIYNCSLLTRLNNRAAQETLAGIKSPVLLNHLLLVACFHRVVLI